MNKLRRTIPLLIAALLMSRSLFAGFEAGKTYHGFRLVEKRFVKEVNAECLLFEHEKSGARLLKIVADDANKTFNIAFKTIPESDAGTPHIMEHSVLNGSKHFPVKSPFDVLSRGSLNTFLNAMTGSHLTTYPVASMNDKDYFNLMHVYLDAVFYPLIYEDPRIFKQEGWHHELTDRDSPVVYKGVVYNEMKGAFSSPERELDFQLMRNLFPDNGYRFSSGGYPPAIPTLTYEAFLNFHRKHYHPGNSYILLYGDADTEKELAFIDENYLSHFDRSDAVVSIAPQKPFSAMKTVEGAYPVPEGSETGGQSFLAMGLIAGESTDRALSMALDVLSDVLVNHESAPLRLALQEAGIGRDVHAAVDELQQNVFEITVRNAEAGDMDRFRELVQNVFRETAEKGLDKKMVEGVLNRMEFRLREGNTSQKGLTYGFQAMNTWFFENDPFPGLEWETPLAEVKEALTSDYLEKVIEARLLDNPHTVWLTLNPQPGLEKEINARTEAELASYKASLSGKELDDLVKSTQELIAYQKREDSPEALATIPMLKRSDIDPKAEWFTVEQKEVSDVPVLFFDDFTNNVVYVDLYFDLRVLPEELIPYAALLSEMLGSLNTESYSFGDLDTELNIHTGGFTTRIQSYLENRDDNALRPKFVVSSRAMKGKVDKLFELTEEIVDRSRFGDRDRMKDVLTRHHSRVESRVKNAGLNYALTRLTSYMTNQGAFEEKIRGLDYYRFITDLTDRFDEAAPAIEENLARTAALLFRRDNLVAAVTCQTDDYPAFAGGLNNLAGTLPADGPKPEVWRFDTAIKDEGLLTASKVQYVVKGYDFKKLGYAWNGKMRVLNQILSTDWLQNQIRVIGGAYGGFSNFSPDGMAWFASYRDPNLKETLDNYNATPGYLENFQADDEAMTRFIIGTVAGLDRPRTPQQRGNQAVTWYFEKVTRNDVQKERDAVLSTTPEDIRSMTKLVSDILARNAFCVYGNEDKIRENKELFNDLVKLDK